MENQTTTTTPIKLNETSTIPNPEPQPSPGKTAAVEIDKKIYKLQTGSFMDIFPNVIFFTGARCVDCVQPSNPGFMIFLGRLNKPIYFNDSDLVFWEEKREFTWCLSVGYVLQYMYFTTTGPRDIEDIPAIHTEKTIKRKIQAMEEEVTEIVKVIGKKQKQEEK